MRDTFERLERLDRLKKLDRLDRLDGLDRLNELERLKKLDRLDRLGRLDEPDGPDGLDIVFEERVSKFKTYRELTRHGNTTPLSCAVRLKNKAIIQLLLQRGSDVWSLHLKVSILGLAKEGGTLDWLVRVMFDNDWDHTYDVNESDPNGGLTALHWALSSTMLGLVKFLLAKGVKVDIADSQGRTPLHYATSVGIPEMVDLLLAKYDKIAVQDSRDKIPLRDTSPGRDLSAAERLKSKKEYVNSRDQQGKTPLHDASAKGHLEVVVFLLSKGADVNVKDKWDRTPLYEAIEAPLDEAIEAPLDNTTKRAQQEDDEEAKAEREKKSHERRLEVVKALVFQGSDLTIRDREGFTPLEFAQRCHRSELGDFLARVQRSGCNMLEQDAIQKAHEQYLERVPAKDTMSSHEKSSWMTNDSPLLEYDDDPFGVSDGEEESTDD
jgi:ankyrin repeat protein